MVLDPSGTKVRKTRGHDQGGSGDHDGRGPEAGVDGVLRVTGADELLAHRRDQEHLVVHRQPEQHAHHEDRQEAHDRPGRQPRRHRGQPAPLEHGDDDPERGARPRADSPALPSAAPRRSGTRSSAASATARSRWPRTAAGRRRAGRRRRCSPRSGPVTSMLVTPYFFSSSALCARSSLTSCAVDGAAWPASGITWIKAVSALCVGGRLGHRDHPGELPERGGQLVHGAHRVSAGDHAGSHRQRGVVALAEGRRDVVVGLALRGVLGRGAVVGQGELQLRGGHGGQPAGCRRPRRSSPAGAR